MEVAQFFANRKPGANQLFPATGGNGKTVVVCSHVYWTDLIGLAMLRLGYNVLMAEPWYSCFTDDGRWNDFDNQYSAWVNTLREQKVVCVIGGNSTCIVPHKRTKELLHRAAGVPVVHYWWDQPRAFPPMSRRGIPLTQYIAALKDERTLNVVWDVDVREEMEQFYGVGNSIHVPLATTAQMWEEPFVPLEKREKPACFLGNCHFVTDEERAGFEPDLLEWARAASGKKIADLDRTVLQCVQDPQRIVVDTSNDEAITRDFRRWFIFDCLLMESQRGGSVKALAEKLGDGFTLIGNNWEKIGLVAAAKHSGIPNAKLFYGSHKISLNLYGGCVHGGMPLRPYEIASSNGLIFTHYNRELPDLFEPGKECVAYRNESEMMEQLERILSHPADYNRVVGAGRRRMIQEHTWENRMKRVMREVGERFGVEV